jgi:hypothetical protein
MHDGGETAKATSAASRFHHPGSGFFSCFPTFSLLIAMRNPLSIFLPLFFAAASLPAQTTYRVDAGVVGGLQNGSTWADAFSDLQAALAAAQHGDEIWVAQGTYLPTPGTDRFRSFDLKSGVRLLGGFAGMEDSAEQRDWSLHPTRLSGNIGDPGTPSDNSVHVVFGRGLDQHTVLDGFVISDGFSLNAPSIVESYGAGMVLLGGEGLADSRPLVANCVFEHNRAAGAGGGLFASFVDPSLPSQLQVEHPVNPVLRNCDFVRNRAQVFGGGFFKDGPALGGDTFLLEGCRFLHNYVYAGDGGGIYFAHAASSSIALRDCVFESDSALT